LVHVGRKDHQVKVKGYRIELAEVEMALLDHEAVKETVILPGKDNTGNQYLVAYFIPVTEDAPTVSALRKFLAEKIPQYMIPSFFVKLDSFPLPQMEKSTVDPCQHRGARGPTWTPLSYLLGRNWKKGSHRYGLMSWVSMKWAFMTHS
jgi:acyl-CoA synthetase (AMP-forming)/AMP-acid ligase II